MNVDLKSQNPAMLRLLGDTNTIVFLDANIFIPPDRSYLRASIKPMDFQWFKDNWLEPLFVIFLNLAIHEAVYDELIGNLVKTYVDAKINTDPARLQIFYDTDLTDLESGLLITFIHKLSVHSSYNPDMNNSKDRGEVRSLSYMTVKGYLYFAANDDLPRRLIENACELRTGLDGMSFLHVYELIFLLYKKRCSDSKALKTLYKYIYFMTKHEKNTNPEWSVFIDCMDVLYSGYLL